MYYQKQKGKYVHTKLQEHEIWLVKIYNNQDSVMHVCFAESWIKHLLNKKKTTFHEKQGSSRFDIIEEKQKETLSYFTQHCDKQKKG